MKTKRLLSIYLILQCILIAFAMYNDSLTSYFREIGQQTFNMMPLLCYGIVSKFFIGSITFLAIMVYGRLPDRVMLTVSGFCLILICGLIVYLYIHPIMHVQIVSLDFFYLLGGNFCLLSWGIVRKVKQKK